ncbi:carbohydrate-binding module family 5 protein, partial [Athelia psychrophila]
SYWGQNSYGATHGSDTANWQQRLSHYCQASNIARDDTIDAIPVAFLNVFFDTGGLPSLDLSNICGVSSYPAFPGTALPDCDFLAADIETCQAAGKIVTISLGGGAGSYGFTSDAQGQAFADTIWNIFLGGTSTTRPFGAAVLDGVDLDIEGGGSTGYAAFVTQLRSHMNGANKSYYITGAPQCPFPDAYLGSVINAVGFDALYVQFYNNYCGLTGFSNVNDWDFGTWDSWAKTTSPNKNVKIYIGAPAASTAAGSGYVDSGTLASIIQSTKSQYSSFGGAMLWDASQAYENGRYDVAVKNALGSNSGGSPVTTTKSTTAATSTTKPSTTTSSTKTTSTSTAAGGGLCGGVAAWMSNVAYTGGSEVTYSGSLWQAKYWSQADAPGGAAGDWANLGPCTAAATIY